MKIDVTCEALRNFAKIARSNGTQDQFIDHFLEWADEADKEINRLISLQPDVQGDCQHEWVSMKNEVIESGKYCPKCHTIRATP